MFRKDEYVVYGNLGVCRVQDIMTRKFEGLSEAHPYYVLEPVYQGGILYVPADNPKIFLREVISEQEANALIDAIPEMEGEEFHSRSVQELSAHYEQAMQSHDCKDLAALAKSIYSKKQTMERKNRKFGQVDEHFMRQAEESLYGELAVALKIPKEAVPDYIARRLGTEPAARS